METVQLFCHGYKRHLIVSEFVMNSTNKQPEGEAIMKRLADMSIKDLLDQEQALHNLSKPFTIKRQYLIHTIT